jgi:bifunctional ADP-heptose synthase (sugar kinase/adenylyltransferase)
MSPAFYVPGSGTSRLVDPTGAGNAFIGGFATGLQQNLPLDKAAAYGNVAASFALEQIGLPELEVHGLVETWNGVKVQERLKEYSARLKSLVKSVNTRVHSSLGHFGHFGRAIVLSLSISNCAITFVTRKFMRLDLQIHFLTLSKHAFQPSSL